MATIFEHYDCNRSNGKYYRDLFLGSQTGMPPPGGYDDMVSSVEVEPGYEYCLYHHPQQGGYKDCFFNDRNRIRPGHNFYYVANENSSACYKAVPANDQYSSRALRLDCDYHIWTAECEGNPNQDAYIGNCNYGSTCYNKRLEKCNGNININSKCKQLCDNDKGRCTAAINSYCNNWNVRNESICNNYNYVANNHCGYWDRRNDSKCANYDYNANGFCNDWNVRNDSKCSNFNYSNMCNWDRRNDGKCSNVKATIVQNTCTNDLFNDADCQTFCNNNPTSCQNSFNKACTANINDNGNCKSFSENKSNMGYVQTLVESYCKDFNNLKTNYCINILNKPESNTSLTNITKHHCEARTTDANFCDCLNIPNVNKTECINDSSTKLNNFCTFANESHIACKNRKGNIVADTCKTDYTKFDSNTCKTYCNNNVELCANSFKTYCNPTVKFFSNSECDTYMTNNTNDTSSGEALTKSIEVIQNNCNQYSQFTSPNCIKYLSKNKLKPTLNNITNTFCQTQINQTTDFCNCINIPLISKPLCLETAKMNKLVLDYCTFINRNERICAQEKNRIIADGCKNNKSYFNDSNGDCQLYCSENPDQCGNSYKAYCNEGNNLISTTTCLNYTLNNLKNNRHAAYPLANQAAQETVINYCNNKDKLSSSFCEEFLKPEYSNYISSKICSEQEYAFDNSSCINYCKSNLSKCRDNFRKFCSKNENINSPACKEYLKNSLDPQAQSTVDVTNTSIDIVKNYCSNENNINTPFCKEFLPYAKLNGTLDDVMDYFCNKEGNKNNELCYCMNKSNMEKFWEGISNVYVKNKALARPDCTYPNCLNNLNKAYKRDYRAPCSGDVICNTTIDKITQFNQCKANIGVVSDCQSIINIANNCGENGIIMTDAPKPPTKAPIPTNQSNQLIQPNQSNQLNQPNQSNQLIQPNQSNQLIQPNQSNQLNQPYQLNNPNLLNQSNLLTYSQGSSNNLLYIVIGIVVLILLLFLLI